MANQQESPGSFDIGWLVGVIESEGCLTIQRRLRKGRIGQYIPLVIVSNTNWKMIENLHRILTEGNVGHHIRWFSVEHLQKFNRRVKKPQANLTIWGLGRVRALLELVGLRWQSRDQEAAVLRSFVAGPTPHSGQFYDELFERCKALKRNPHRLHVGPGITGDDIVETTARSVE